jgi:hypothetical protein
MNSSATELLTSEPDARLNEGHSPATEQKWPRRWSVGFVIGVSSLLWVTIVLAVRGGF